MKAHGSNYTGVLITLVAAAAGLQYGGMLWMIIGGFLGALVAMWMNYGKGHAASHGPVAHATVKAEAHATIGHGAKDAHAPAKKDDHGHAKADAHGHDDHGHGKDAHAPAKKDAHGHDDHGHH